MITIVASTQLRQTVLFSLTLFLSAALMFTVQPMLGKMMLPLFGGAPSVWLAAMVFFQLVLLGGYYAAFLLSRLPVMRHVGVLCAVLLCGLFFLPVRIEGVTSGLSGPLAQAFDVLLVLGAAIFVPFAGLSALSPSLQRLFGSLEGKRDPYFLFAASNLGSFGGLLAYPLGFESLMGLSLQGQVWRWGFALLALCVALCLWTARHNLLESEQKKDAPATRVPAREIALWVVLAFVPSALMYGVTASFTSDVGGVPLFWVLPLGLYLLTFVMAFAQPKAWRGASLYMSCSAIAFVPLFLPALMGEAWPNLTFIYALFSLASFTLLARLCHGLLADRRPLLEHLTRYYLWVSVGGALGGVFSVFVVPVLLTSAVEYLALTFLSILLLPFLSRKGGGRPSALEIAGFLALLLGLIGMRYVAGAGALQPLLIPVCAMALAVGAALAASRPAVLALLVVAMVMTVPSSGKIVEVARARNFFGLMRVRDVTEGELTVRQFFHGTTLHGLQIIKPEVSLKPVSYYGPLGPVLERFKPHNVGLIGLGAGLLNCYTAPDRHFTIYEIAPDVVRLAQQHFTFLSACGQPDIIVEDGRKGVARYDGKPFDIFIVDAFSSDAIPVHLLTQEAIALYLSKMTPDAVLILHISNRYFNLLPPVATLAAQAGLTALHLNDAIELAKGLQVAFPSRWVLMTRAPKKLEALRALGWQDLPPAQTRIWTDDYSYPLSTLKLFEREPNAQTH